MDKRHLPPDSNRLRGIPITVTVRVCNRSVKLDELVKWMPGTMLTFDLPATSGLKLRIGNRQFGEGHAVKVGSMFGIQIEEVGS